MRYLRGCFWYGKVNNIIPRKSGQDTYQKKGKHVLLDNGSKSRKDNDYAFASSESKSCSKETIAS